MYLRHGLQLVILSAFISIDSHTKIHLAWMVVIVSLLLEMIHEIGRPARHVVEEHLGRGLCGITIPRSTRTARRDRYIVYASASEHCG